MLQLQASSFAVKDILRLRGFSLMNASASVNQMMQMQRFGLYIAPASDPPGVGFAQFRRDRPLDRFAQTRRDCIATSPLIGGCAPLRIEFLSAAALPSLFEKGGAENGAGIKAPSI